MFRARIAAQKLRESIGALRALISEAKFGLKPEGISVLAFDPANVAAVNLELSSDAFESYEASGGEIGIDLVKLSDAVDIAPKDGVIELELDEHAHRLVIKASGLTYTAALIDPSSIRKGPGKFPDVELPGSATIRGEDLRRGLKAAETVGDYVYIGILGDVFFIEGQGDVDSVRFEQRDGIIDLKPADVKAMFSIEYLLAISKVAAKVPQVTVSLGKDYPVKFAFGIAEGGGEVVYVIAPRVESG